MKTITQSAMFVFAALSLVFGSCKKSNDTTTTANGNNADSINTLLTSGSWVVASMTEGKEDNTSKLKDYTITFSAGGKMSVLKAGVSTDGSWNYTAAVTYYGSSSKQAFNMNMGTGEPLRRLTGTWNIVSRTANSLQLENPEIQEEERLLLQKK